MKGPLCAHQCCPIGVGAHSGAHFCTDTHGGGALGDALGDRVMTLALWRAISQQEQPDLVLFAALGNDLGKELVGLSGADAMDAGGSHMREPRCLEKGLRSGKADSARIINTASMHVELLAVRVESCLPGLLPSTQTRQPFRPPLLRRLPSSRGPQRSVEDVHPTTHARGGPLPRGLRERRDERRARQLEGHARPTQSTVGDLKKLSRPTPCTPGKNT